jgi:rare lipoprotein A
MYLPATPAPTAPTLQPAEIVSSAATPPPAPTVPFAPTVPLRTLLRVRRTALNVLDGHAASVTGSLLAGARTDGGRAVGVAWAIVTLQARGPNGWQTLAGARTGLRGRYRLRYATHRVGSERLRVSFAGDTGERGTQLAVGRLNVYRLAVASWYGGEGSLACGGWLTSSTLGVANKTLPCGTLVTLRYGARTVRVPVVDRGPYVEGREFDLTEATKRALGFEGVGEVWATG